MAHIKVDILYEVFSYLKRHHLDRCCLVCKNFRKIIEKYFSAAPYYVVNDIRLLTYQSNRTCSTTYKNKGEFLELSYSHPVTQFPVYGTFESLLPYFQTKTLRAKCFVLMAAKLMAVEEFSPCVSAIINALQKLSHCWKNYDCNPNYMFIMSLTIVDEETKEWTKELLCQMSECVPEDGVGIVGSCAQLEISGCIGTSIFGYEFAYPLLYTFSIIVLAGEIGNIGCLATYLNQQHTNARRKKERKAQSISILVLNKSALEVSKNKKVIANFIKHLMEAFVKSKHSRSYTLEFACYPERDRMYKEAFAGTAPFKTINSTTKEKLQLEHVGAYKHIFSRSFI